MQAQDLLVLLLTLIFLYNVRPGLSRKRSENEERNGLDEGS